MVPPRVFCLLPKRKSRLNHNHRQITLTESGKLPLLFSFVCDISASMRDNDKYKVVQEAVIDIFNNVLENDDKLELVTFGSEAKKVINLKKKREINAISLQDQLIPSGSSLRALFDAIGMSIADLDKNDKYWRYQREMIVLTDGTDNNTNNKYRDLATLKALIRNPDVANFHIIIIGVGLPVADAEVLASLCKGVRHADYYYCGNSQADVQQNLFKARQAIEHNRARMLAKVAKNRANSEAHSGNGVPDNVNGSNSNLSQDPSTSAEDKVIMPAPAGISYLQAPPLHQQLKKMNSSPQLSSLLNT